MVRRGSIKLEDGDNPIVKGKKVRVCFDPVMFSSASFVNYFAAVPKLTTGLENGCKTAPTWEISKSHVNLVLARPF